MFFLYTDGVYDGSDKEGSLKLEQVVRENYQRPAKDICKALAEYAVKEDDRVRRSANSIVSTTRKFFSSNATERHQMPVQVEIR